MTSNPIQKWGAAGFTLIETLVAVLLLTTAIAGPLTIASRGLLAATVARNQITAFYLAQDAVEYMRYKRDSNKLAGQGWLTGLDKCVSADGSKTCEVNTLQDSINSCFNGVCDQLAYDTSLHTFNYDATAPTNPNNRLTPQQYIRTIKMTTVSASEVSLLVSVSWRDLSGVTHPPITVKEILFDWQ